jgi:hypothetical protein
LWFYENLIKIDDDILGLENEAFVHIEDDVLFDGRVGAYLKAGTSIINIQ